MANCAIGGGGKGGGKAGAKPAGKTGKAGKKPMPFVKKKGGKK